MDIISCFIMGHRTDRFRFKCNEDNELCARIKLALREEILRHIKEENVTRFYSGGAIGADIWGAEIVLELQKSAQFRDVELFVARPFPTHGSKYDANCKARYAQILTQATNSVVTYARPLPSSYKRRNYYMVDNCTLGIAVYDNDRSIQTGIGQTVDYALSKNVKLTLIHPDTAGVSVIEERKLPAMYAER